jgi:hypothetical protein
MKQIKNVKQLKNIGLAFTLVLYPLFAGFAFAVHPNVFSLQMDIPVATKIAEFHNNQLLHTGHLLMLAGVPLLITIAVHFMSLLEDRSVWWGLIGGIMAVSGAVILAVDKAALCLVPSALDTLPEAQFQAMIPGITAMFAGKGGLWVLQLLPILPVGFAFLSIGLLRAKALPLQICIPILVGSLLMANPDIDLIGLIATACLAIGFFQYALQLLRTDVLTSTIKEL